MSSSVVLFYEVLMLDRQGWFRAGTFDRLAGAVGYLNWAQSREAVQFADVTEYLVRSVP